MDNWLPIETAPKDGTTILLKNSSMDKPVRGHWGLFKPKWADRTYLNWVSDFTPDEFLPFPSGRLVCPEEWASVAPSTTGEGEG